MSEDQPVLVIIGPPGAGKSIVGKLVAKFLQVPFVDTDRRIADRHGAISTIFAKRGEHEFRALERVEVAQALNEAGVIALGGGAVLHPQTQEDLAAARVAYLTVSPNAVTRRIRGTQRPLLVDGIESWKNILNERQEIYARLATITIDSSHRTAKSIAHELAALIQQEENT